MARNSVQSVDRVAALLAVLGEAPHPLRVRELAGQLRLPRPTVYRLLRTLTTHGLAATADGGFVIGPRVLWLAAQRLEQIELRTVGRPFLTRLRDETGDTAHLAVMEQGQVVYIDKVESAGPLRMVSAIGKIMPAHCTALGKAMLALLPHEQVQTIVAARGLPRRTPNTVTDLHRLLEDLAAARARGYAVDNVENEDGVRCVGAAILDHAGDVAGAISVSGSAASVTVARVRKDLGPRVRDAAHEVSGALGA